jgi:hypothetical protein
VLGLLVVLVFVVIFYIDISVWFRAENLFESAVFQLLDAVTRIRFGLLALVMGIFLQQLSRWGTRVNFRLHARRLLGVSHVLQAIHRV